MTEQKPREDLWDANVAEAKRLTMNTRSAQMEIARLALEACEVKWGGSALDDRFTLRRFAKEAGLAEKTLNNWCAVRRHAYEKISDPEKNSVPYSVLQRVAMSVTPETSREDVEAAFREILTIEGEDNRLLKYISNLRTAHNNILNEAKFLKVKHETLDEAYFYAQGICRTLEAKGFKPVNHNLLATSGYLRNGARVPALTDESLKNSGGALSGADEKVVLAMIESGDSSFTPSKIGKTAFPLKSPLGAKLCALRTFYKLCAYGKLVQPSRGKYQWAPKKGAKEVRYEI